MTAGMVSVPAIIPLKPPGLGATGSRKWSVDTNTYIEMQTSTKNCIIFYTLDGTKPDPFKKIGEKTTYQYTKAITLRQGKRTLKAIAVLKDGTKVSNANTKVFQVSVATEVKSDEETGDSKFNTTWHSQISDDETDNYDHKMFKKVMKSSEEKLPNTQRKDLVKRVLTDTMFSEYSYDQGKIEEDEYLSCSYCHVPRPRDPYARFCNGCNASLPPAPGKIRSPRPYSNFAKSNERSPGSRHTISDRVNCKNCGTTNPLGTAECLVCEEPIGSPVSKLGKTKAPVPSDEFIVCPYCTRVNSADARFCDWCGEKSQTLSRSISCERCSTENSVSSQYCCSCGKILTAPPRKSFENVLSKGDIKVREPPEGSNLELLSKLTESENPTWKSIEFEAVSRKQAKNVSIQVGDSMVSAMDKLSLKNGNKASAGKGYWRQQVDFVTQHLKVFTQNNVNFRDQFSNYALSRLVSAGVSEAVTDKEKEVELTMVFNLHETNIKGKKLKSTKTVNSGETLINALSAQKLSKSSSRPSSGRSRPSSGRARASSNRERTDSVQSNQSNNSRPSSGRKKKVSQKTLEKEKHEAFLSKLSDDTKKLLNILQSSKEADIEKTEILLESDDIDVNGTSENSIPFLKLCVINKHFDLLHLLITTGADIDAISGVKETTSLHEAVMLGVNGREAVDILLDNDATTDIKDKRGKTAHDIAVDNGHEIILSVFTKHTSKGLLKDVMKL